MTSERDEWTSKVAIGLTFTTDAGDQEVVIDSVSDPAVLAAGLRKGDIITATLPLRRSSP